jgi:glycosyltransferase involved in cell wall biosynthesis
MIEAMACGTPVIACRRGSVPELVRHGETGWIVGGVDEAVAVLDGTAALDRQRIRAHVAAHFSRERMVDNYLRVYTAIVHEHSRGSSNLPT